MANVIITSFNNGEVSPAIDCRSDIAKHSSSCKQMKNMLPSVEGTASRRPGTRYVKPAAVIINATVTPIAINVAMAVPEAAAVDAGVDHTETPSAINVAVAVPAVTVDEGRPDWPGGFPDGIPYTDCPPTVVTLLSEITLCGCECDHNASATCDVDPSANWYEWQSSSFSAGTPIPTLSGDNGCDAGGSCDCTYTKTGNLGSSIELWRFLWTFAPCDNRSGHLTFTYTQFHIQVSVIGSVVTAKIWLIGPAAVDALVFNGVGSLSGSDAVDVANTQDCDLFELSAVAGPTTGTSFLNAGEGGTIRVT